MDNIQLCFVGWRKQQQSDRIWGVIKIDENLSFTFWGNRTGKLIFKKEIYPKKAYVKIFKLWKNKTISVYTVSVMPMEHFIEEKIKKGYIDITNETHHICENFETYLIGQLLTAKILGKVKNKKY